MRKKLTGRRTPLDQTALGQTAPRHQDRAETGARNRARNRLAPALTLLGLLGLSALAAAKSEDACITALPLPLDHAVHGYAIPQEPAHYAVEVTHPSLLLVEAHALDRPEDAPRLRLRDSSCRKLTSSLPVPAISGRQVHRIARPGTYFIEVDTGRSTGAAFRIDAWLVANERVTAGWMKDGEDPPQEPMDEADERPISSHESDRLPIFVFKNDPPEDPPQEPMDEADERPISGYEGDLLRISALKNDPPEDPPQEPMDEADERPETGLSKIADRTASFSEIPGHGLLEEIRSPAGVEVHWTAWCPWAQRPGLLATFTCARRIQVSESGRFEVAPMFAATREIVGFDVAADSSMALVTADESARLFDGAGRMLSESLTEEAHRLPAGSYYLEIDALPDSEMIELFFELD